MIKIYCDTCGKQMASGYSEWSISPSSWFCGKSFPNSEYNFCKKECMLIMLEKLISQYESTKPFSLASFAVSLKNKIQTVLSLFRGR